MLKYFLSSEPENKCNKYFSSQENHEKNGEKGKKPKRFLILDEEEIIKHYKGKFPVVFLNLKTVNGRDRSSID